MTVTTGALLRLALPATLFAILHNGFRSVDQYWIQDAGEAAQAAIGSSTFVLIFYYAAAELVAAGAGPLIARATGARDDAGRRATLGAALFAVGLVTLAVMLGGGLLAGHITGLLGLEGDAATQCTAYLRTLALACLPLMLQPTVDATFLSMGSARVPMLLHGLALAVNITLTPVLIYTAGLGVTGAALAAMGSMGLAACVGVVVVSRRCGLRLSDLRPGPALGRLLRVGAPIAVGTATYALVYWAMLRTSISPLGPHVNAALGIGFSALEGFTWPMFLGVSLAVSSFVGRALGAGEVDAAWATLRRAWPLSTALGLVAALAFGLGGRYLTGLFASTPLVHDAATEYAVVLAFSQVFVAWESLFEGVLGGAGDTRTLFYLSMPLNLLRVPLAWWMSSRLGLGAAGVWWAINVTTYAKAVLKGLAVRRGRWAGIVI